MRLFHLQRLEDESGVSGTGRVADGVVFEDGHAVIRWRTATSSTACYDSIEDVEAIHGHNGKTIVVWDDEVTNERDKKLLNLLRDTLEQVEYHEDALAAAREYRDAKQAFDEEHEEHIKLRAKLSRTQRTVAKALRCSSFASMREVLQELLKEPKP